MDSEAIAKAREALRQKMAELDRAPAQQPTPPAPVAPAPVAKPVVQTPPPVKRPLAVTTAPAPAPAPEPVAVVAKPKKAEKTVKAQSQATSSQPVAAKSQDTASKSQAKATAEKAPKKTAAVSGANALTPIQAPPSSLSAEKQQRLAELLSKYRAEQITPEEYHQQRARILSEP